MPPSAAAAERAAAAKDPRVKRMNALVAGDLAFEEGVEFGDCPFDDKQLAEAWRFGWRVASRAAAQRAVREAEARGRAGQPRLALDE